MLTRIAVLFGAVALLGACQVTTSGPIRPETCGNRICTSGETCSNCPEDCGVCPSGDPCTSSCSYIYDTCQLQLVWAGSGAMSKSGCISTCNSDQDRVSKSNCVMNSGCTSSTIQTCISGGTPPPPDPCQSSCNKIYDQCGLKLVNSSGADMSKAECLSYCNADQDKVAKSNCVNSKSCSDTQGITACITGGAPGGDCASACSQIYDSCKLVLQNSSGQDISEAQCVTECQNAPHASQVPSCVNAAKCNSSSIVACFN